MAQTHQEEGRRVSVHRVGHQAVVAKRNGGIVPGHGAHWRYTMHPARSVLHASTLLCRPVRACVLPTACRLSRACWFVLPSDSALIDSSDKSCSLWSGTAQPPNPTWVFREEDQRWRKLSRSANGTFRFVAGGEKRPLQMSMLVTYVKQQPTKVCVCVFIFPFDCC